MRVSRDGTTVRRLHNDRYFSRGIAFSSRPVEIKERIYLKISETTDRWSGGLRVGFTCIDPAVMECKVPELLVPNARRLKGFWARAIPVKHNIQDCVVYFYVSLTGKLVICINGKKKILCDGINTRIPLWAAVDVYGNCTGVQIIDSNSNLIPELSRMSITEEEEVRRWPIRFNDSRGLAPLLFHNTKGRSVHMSEDGCVASRSQSSYEQGYVFTMHPITYGEKIIIQVLKSDVRFSGSLAFGLTSCNPASLRQSDLPDDSDVLLDRPEYWVVTKNVSSSSRTGDEIALCVTPTGEVTISKNGSPPVFLMNVDVTLQLWAFMDIYGSTESIRMFKQVNRNISTCSINSQAHDNRAFSQSITSAPSCQTMNSAPSCQTMMSAASSTILSTSNIGSSRIINVPASTAMGGTVLVLNLPSTSQNLGSLNGIITASQVGFLLSFFFIDMSGFFCLFVRCCFS